MAHWWERNIIEPGKLPLLLALASFVLAFAVTRTITRLIRAGKGPFGNVSAGGTHIHHAVPGVVLMVIGGFTALSAWTDGGHDLMSAVAAVLFGTGVGLVLDEFALILYLADVYWTDQGRKSVETVALTVALVTLILAGVSPFGVDNVAPEEQQNRAAAAATVTANFLLAVLALAKGKRWIALVGMFVFPVAAIGAVRLARPHSPWADRCYRNRSRALERARERAERHDARWDRIARRLQDLVGGAPDR